MPANWPPNVSDGLSGVQVYSTRPGTIKFPRAGLFDCDQATPALDPEGGDGDWGGDGDGDGDGVGEKEGEGAAAGVEVGVYWRVEEVERDLQRLLLDRWAS